MKLLAVTCATGSKADAMMTSDCAKTLRDCIPARTHFLNVCLAQELDGGVDGFDVVKTTSKNEGFAIGMNRALQIGLGALPVPDFVLIYNNDLVWCDQRAIKALVVAATLKFPSIFCPMTNFTSQPKQKATQAKEAPPIRVDFAPAIAWFMPRSVMALRKDEFFPEDVGMAWGEDDFVAAWMRKHLHPHPFVLVQDSFVRHLGSVTSNRIPVSERVESVDRAMKRAIAEDLPWIKR